MSDIDRQFEEFRKSVAALKAAIREINGDLIENSAMSPVFGVMIRALCWLENWIESWRNVDPKP